MNRMISHVLSKNFNAVHNFQYKIFHTVNAVYPEARKAYSAYSPAIFIPWTKDIFDNYVAKEFIKYGDTQQIAEKITNEAIVPAVLEWNAHRYLNDKSKPLHHWMMRPDTNTAISQEEANKQHQLFPKTKYLTVAGACCDIMQGIQEWENQGKVKRGDWVHTVITHSYKYYENNKNEYHNELILYTVPVGYHVMALTHIPSNGQNWAKYESRF